MKENDEQNCRNCGHSCHCGKKCEQSNVDEFGNLNTFECCKYCRHDGWEDEVKFDIDSFNGA